MNPETLSQEEINQIVADAMTELPEEIQSAIENSNWHATLRTLVLKYKLRIDQGNLLENHTLFTMMGINKPNHLLEVIAGFGLTPDQMQALVNDVEQQIFDKIKNLVIAKMSDEEKKEFMDPVIPGAVSSSTTPAASMGQSPEPSRDSILAEIEKEDPDLGAMQIRQIPHPSSPTDTRDPIIEIPVAPVSPSAVPETTPIFEGKIAQPFSLNSEPAPTPIQTPDIQTPAVAPVQIATGIQKDPVQSGLTQATAIATEPVTSQPTAAPVAPKAYAADPYREPIE